MKKIYFIGALALAGMSLTGCNDFLNDNRFPLSDQIENPMFWNNGMNVENQINTFYNDFLGYGNGTGSGDFYFKTLNDDQCGRREFTDWTFVTVPSSSGSWNDPYEEIRRANIVIGGLANSTLPASERDNYMGQARLYRAKGYFDLVRRYGDVPLVEKALDPAEEAALFGPRTPRAEVMDFILEDLKYAASNISDQKNANYFSSDLANAMIVEVGIYEGAYAKYHLNDAARSKQYYGEAITAGEAIAGRYPICADYTSLYKSLRTDGGGYTALEKNPEIIFMKAYEQGVFMHSIVDYSSASDGIAGLTKDAFDSYLFIDGRPAATTTLDKTDAGVADGDAALSIQGLLDVRDQRLAMTTYPNVFYPGMTWTGPNTAAMYSQTGYGVAKFDNWTFSANDAQTANRGYNCCPLYWGARLYLGIAEAKAENGTLTDADVAKYIKPLWDRAGIDTSNLNLAWLANMNDPANDMGVSSLIWEIRRCRRCELIMDDNIRYWDLVRWHQLDKLDTTKNPDIVLGANIANAPVAYDNVVGNYINCSYGRTRKFEDKYYLYPVPGDQLDLNEKLTQNPGWK
jgi:hypothetical protein